MKRRILVLSYYFPPDLSAGSFRADSLVKALIEQGDGDLEIDVVTTMPNRYGAMASEHAPAHEVLGRTKITRIGLLVSGNDRLSQIRQFFGFARAAAKLTKNRHYDLVFGTSSRLMTAVLATYIAKRARLPLYIDIRDIFVETMSTLSKSKISSQLLKLFGLLERWVVLNADGINVVSAGFIPYFHARYGNDLKLDVFTNGIDESFMADFSSPVPKTDKILDIVYAGNIGDGQGLDLILPELGLRLEGIAHFRVVGDGGRIEPLREALKARGVTNITLMPPVARAKILDIYREADILFLHLNDIAAFERVIPSKIFEYAATGKPILAGVSGFSADFIAKQIENAAIFAPCDVEGGIKALKELSPHMVNRNDFRRKYERKTIMSRMANRILEIAISKEK